MYDFNIMWYVIQLSASVTYYTMRLETDYVIDFLGSSRFVIDVVMAYNIFFTLQKLTEIYLLVVICLFLFKQVCVVGTDKKHVFKKNWNFIAFTRSFILN